MIKFNLGLRDTDLERIALIKALYPNPENTTEAIRLALAEYIRKADPVALAEARKQARRASKEQAK